MEYTIIILLLVVFVLAFRYFRTKKRPKITRKSEKDTAIPSSITTHRDAVRAKQAEMETAITNASDTPALEALYTRNSEGVRPLGDLPILED